MKPVNFSSTGKIVLLVVATLAFLGPISTWKIRENQIIDAQGRSRLFHGVDITYKSAPYVP